MNPDQHKPNLPGVRDRLNRAAINSVIAGCVRCRTKAVRQLMNRPLGGAMFGHTLKRSLVLLATVGLVGALASATAVPAAADGRHRGGDDDNRYQQVNLVSDQVGMAENTDPNLVNPWGLAFGPNTPLWVSDNGMNVSTLYSGATTPSTPVTQVPLVVSIPGGSPTGVVFAGAVNFPITKGDKTGPALFIFAGENGEISAWNQTGDKTKAVLMTTTTDAVYKGLALLRNSAGSWLLAANFHDNRIDVFDSTFTLVHSMRFSSVGIPRGYAPFDVAVFGKRVFVSYAKQNAQRHDDVAGPGHGFINTFDLNGHFVKRFASRGVLDSPWGLAIAPKGFGELSGDLLVGNFGNGRINAFDVRSGEREGTLHGTDGLALVIDGLWGLLPGNGTAGGTSDVWFSAGPAGETHGLLGVLRATHE
jgi:uncharacterized protein (TIGR03118 family)